GIDAETLAECAAQVSDTGETIALLIDTLTPPESHAQVPALAEVMGRMKPRGDLQAATDWALTGGLSLDARTVLVKLLTGTFRTPASQPTLVQALAEAFGVRAPVVAHRLLGRWTPMADFEAWLARGGDVAPSAAYPFVPAATLPEPHTAPLGDLAAWQVEWTRAGEPVQLIRRDGAVYLWTADGAMIARRCPEIAVRAVSLPDGTVIAGRLFAGRLDAPMPDAVLRRRMTRKTAPPALQVEAPLCFVAEDLLEDAGVDQRAHALATRRATLQLRLAEMVDPFAFVPPLAVSTWADVQALRQRARSVGALGITVRGDAQIWQWPADPLTVTAVLIYGEARRSGPTRYTLGVWSDALLVPIAKPTTGLDAAQRTRLDRWIRAETVERFGPVRSVPGVQVFDVAFDGIDRSARHAAGLVLRGARIVGWRHALAPTDADTLADLEALIPCD
ncbi:MAG: DNA ligase-1, partial [Bradymonadia bacterium]